MKTIPIYPLLFAFSMFVGMASPLTTPFQGKPIQVETINDDDMLTKATVLFNNKQYQKAAMLFDSIIDGNSDFLNLAVLQMAGDSHYYIHNDAGAAYYYNRMYSVHKRVNPYLTPDKFLSKLERWGQVGLVKRMKETHVDPS